MEWTSNGTASHAFNNRGIDLHERAFQEERTQVLSDSGTGLNYIHRRTIGQELDMARERRDLMLGVMNGDVMETSRQQRRELSSIDSEFTSGCAMRFTGYSYKSPLSRRNKDSLGP
jgi:hypothetical protein